MGFHRLRACAVCALVVSFLCINSSSVGAQARRQFVPPPPNDDAAKISINTEVISLTVTVTDERGRLLPGLERGAFTLHEDKIAQEITYFSYEDAPLSVGIVFDISGSMTPLKIERAKAALRRFIQTSHAEDEYTLVGFNDRARVLIAGTRDAEALLRAFSGVQPRGQTALYDAVGLAVAQLAHSQYPRRALLIVSDGEDNYSRAGFGEMRRKLLESGVTVYALGVMDWELPGATGRNALQQLAAVSGGQAFFPQNLDEMCAAFEQIALELRQQYSLGYAPTNFAADGKWRKLKISVAPPPGVQRVVVRSRAGYYAVERAQWSGEKP